MTKYFATYFSNIGILSMAISPGEVYESQSIEFQKNISELIPLGRMAKADEYKFAIKSLSSDASSYMNSQNLVIDGGR